MKDYSGKKLCSLVKKDVQADKPKAYASLIDSPAYFCTKCGRAANNEDSLCKPEKIKLKKAKDSKKQA